MFEYIPLCARITDIWQEDMSIKILCIPYKLSELSIALSHEDIYKFIQNPKKLIGKTRHEAILHVIKAKKGYKHLRKKLRSKVVPF